MKKLLALLLALVMVLSLAACGEEVDEGTSRRRRKASSNDEETTETVSETGEENEEVTKEVTEEEVSEETEPAEEQEEDDAQWLSAYTVIEELDATVIDEDGLTVTIGELEEGTYWLEMPVEMKNTSKGTLSVTSVGTAINGKSASLFLTGSVEAGKTATDTLDFYDFSDPEDVTRVSLFIRVTDENWENKDYLIDIYPYGMDAHKQTFPKAKGDDVMVDEDGVFAALQDYKESSDAFTFEYVMINKSEEVVHLSMDPVAVSGFGVTNYISDCLLPGTYNEDEAEIVDYSYLTELGMDEVSSVTFDVSVNDASYDVMFEEQITVYPGGKKNDDEFVYTQSGSDLVLVDTDAAKVIFVEALEEEYTGEVLLFVIENKTKGFVNVEGTEMKINGKTFDSGWIYCSTYEGRDTFEAYTLYSFQLEELGITEVTSVEMLLSVTDNNYDVVFEETVEITFS